MSHLHRQLMAQASIAHDEPSEPSQIVAAQIEAAQADAQAAGELAARRQAAFVESFNVGTEEEKPTEEVQP